MGCFFVSNSKKELSKAEAVAQWQDVFRCPLCYEKMKMSESKSLICAKGHCFDFSKSGYFNFLSHPHQDNYTKHLFAARRRVFQSGFFDLLLFKISDWILNGVRRDSYKILDAGCGEGSSLSKIQAMLKQNNVTDVLGIGLDISKEGLILLPRNFQGLFGASLTFLNLHLLVTSLISSLTCYLLRIIVNSSDCLLRMAW